MTSPFTDLIDLAAERLGGKALSCNDEFFAPKENLLKPGRGIFIADKFTSRGKWMDGWETRRRRTPGYDWCVIRLGLPGVLRGFDVDTNHFIGNFPESCSIEAAALTSRPSSLSAELAALEKTHWAPIVPRSVLQGGSQNLFGVHHDQITTHLRLNIFPDGGVARLRAYGEPSLDLAGLAASSKLLDAAALTNGGLVLGVSDDHFGRRHNMLMPGRAKNMGDGWETKRRRGPGFDWAVVRLCARVELVQLEVDTNHFKGNYPDSCMVQGCDAARATNEDLESGRVGWREVLPQTKLGPHRRHHFKVSDAGPFTHLKLNIYPDGGVSRFRAHGRFVQTQRAAS